jgi:hypothetical protein
MSKSSAEKSAQEVDPLDETLPLPALESLLEASDETLQETSQVFGGTGQPSPVEPLRRLVELSESIDGRLAQIAELLTEQRQQSSGRAASRKTARKAGKRAGAVLRSTGSD